MSTIIRPTPRPVVTGLNDPRSTGSRPKPRLADIQALRGTLTSRPRR